MKKFLVLAVAVLSLTQMAMAQPELNYQGKVVDENKNPLAFATISFLEPSDSTLAFFGISNDQGQFEVRQVKPGEYLMQVAFLGYDTYYQPINTGEIGNQLGDIQLNPKSVALDGVEVTGERIPIVIKKDTIEYNAGAFRTKADADVEGLLKKLPGVEVDRDGKIKAQGEDVTKILVDGKEFFGNDPTVATKNLPADAIKKVQVFDKKSDVAEFTGIDDGERQKTINLLLKDGKKSGYFGDVTAGGGTNETYQGKASVNRFTKKTQLSALARMNNINDYGFSINDYLNFSGGMKNLMNGGGGEIRATISDGEIPINVGQQQNGLLTSGAGGLNFNYFPRDGNEVNVNYIANYANRDLNQTSQAETFINDKDYFDRQTLNNDNTNIQHRGAVYWKNNIDSLNRFILRVNGTLTNSETDQASMFTRFNTDETVASSYNNLSNNNADGLSASADATWVKKSAIKKGRILKLNAGASTQESSDNTYWNNETQQPIYFLDSQFRDDKTVANDFGGTVSFNEPLGKANYIEVEVGAESQNDTYTRNQFNRANNDEVLIPNLSPDFERSIQILTPGVNWKRNRDKSQLTVGLDGHISQSDANSIANPDTASNKTYQYLLPNFSWRKEISNSSNFRFRLTSNINYAGVQQMLPTLDISNPINLTQGNIDLDPEYQNTLSGRYMIFDQFSFTSFFAYVAVTRTDNKISYERNFDNAGVQSVKTINYKDQLGLTGNYHFGTTVRKLGIKLNADLNHNYSWGYNLINNEENKASSYTHGGNLSITNRKSDVVLVEVGGGYSHTQSKYSIQTSQNNTFSNWSLFAEIDWNISDKWNLNTSMDYNVYSNQNFGDQLAVPLWQASFSRYFMANNRATISITAFDILNKYQGIERYTNQYSIGETRSNVIGQYFMLNFKYKLNKLGAESKGGVNFNMKPRRR